MRYAVLIAALLGIALSCPAHASACTVCHSKNPKMVRMHKALEYKNCFSCHGPASKRKAPSAADERATDPLCSVCHGTGKGAVTGKPKSR